MPHETPYPYLVFFCDVINNFIIVSKVDTNLDESWNTILRYFFGRKIVFLFNFKRKNKQNQKQKKARNQNQKITRPAVTWTIS